MLDPMNIGGLACSTGSIVVTLLLGSCSADGHEPSLDSPLPTKSPASSIGIKKTVDHGRIEDHGGLRVLRLWGSPRQRGRAHGQLVGAEIVDLLRLEIRARFSKQPTRLAQARALLPLIVGYPRAYRVEILAMYAAIEEQGVDLSLPGYDRNFDEKDLLLVNAMDLIVQMGCSGFTLWGDQVVGGGVLTARNFDWPVTGTYLVENCLLIVQHPDDGAAFAAVAWPGYVGAVTGINEHGVAVFLHVGDASGGIPRPGSYPTATAAREILRQADAESAFEIGRDMLAKTCPPRGFITRVVGPDAGDDLPVRIFETDRKGVTHRKGNALCVVTNHFLSRDRENGRGDSKQRWTRIRAQLREDLTRQDRKVSVDEAWHALAIVDRSGRHGTLHSLVFRHDPWVFELAIGTPSSAGSVLAAPSHGTRYRLSREAVFADIR